MKKSILLMIFPFFVILAAGCNHSQEIGGQSPSPVQGETQVIDTSVIDSWKIAETPQRYTDEWYQANHSVRGVHAVVRDNALTAEAGNPSYPNELTVSNGKFKGHNQGEWGGGVKFAPKLGIGYKVLNENFCAFYQIGDRYYVVTGLAHLSYDEGSIYELVFTNRNRKWNAEKILDLGSCPEAFLLYGEALYVVTNEALMLIENNKISKTLVDGAFWQSLYPNSIVYADSSLYIGMRGGIFSYDLLSGEEIWYDFTDDE